jgi:hypothetical protein
MVTGMMAATTTGTGTESIWRTLQITVILRTAAHREEDLDSVMH